MARGILAFNFLCVLQSLDYCIGLSSHLHLTLFFFSFGVLHLQILLMNPFSTNDLRCVEPNKLQHR
jgi:hypothetical protein